MHPQEELLPSRNIHAAIRLLVDPDPKVHDACRQQLLQWGEAARRPLQETSVAEDQRLRGLALELLRALDLRNWGAKVAEAAIDCSILPLLDDYSVALERAALAIAGLDRAQAPDARRLAEYLAERATHLRIALREGDTPARALPQVMREPVELKGMSRRSFSPDAVFLDRILEIGYGSSSALSLLWVLVGRRAGLRVGAVALGGHFLVRLHGQRSMLLDPFHGGRSVTRADCVRYLKLAGHSGTASHALADVSDRRLLIGLLEDLVRVYGYRENVAVISAVERAIQLLAIS